MIAKPESVESVVDVVSLLECDYLGQGAARTHRKDCRKCRVWTAHRAELAEALMPLREAEWKEYCDEHGVGDVTGFLAHRRRKHGVDKDEAAIKDAADRVTK